MYILRSPDVMKYIKDTLLATRLNNVDRRMDVLYKIKGDTNNLASVVNLP